MRVAVVGTGTIGAMALWRLAERGIKAVGFEAYAPGHDRGAAGGESRIFRMAYREGPEYVPLLTSARQMWHELESHAPGPLFYRSGFVTVGDPDHPDIVTSMESVRVHGLDIEVLDAHQAAQRVPEHPVRDGETMIFDPLGGLLLPERSVLTAAARAEELGAEIRRYQRVTDIVEHADHATVVTGDRGEAFDQVIVACGPWVGDLAVLEGLTLQPKQLTATWFPRRSHDRFVLGKTPTALRVGTPGFSCFPAVDGNGVKVIAHGAYTEIDDPEGLPRSATEAVVRRASGFVAEVLPDLYPDPIRVATFSDAYTPDYHPYLGRADSGSSIIHASGFSGHGFKLAPMFGELLADVVIDDQPRVDIGFMDPARFTAGAAS